MPMSDRIICTEDFFFAKRNYSHLSTVAFKNYEIGMHLHNFYEINIVLNGSGIHYIENNMYKIKKGFVFVIPPGIYHGYRNNKNLEVYHILISNNYMARYASELECIESYIKLFSIDPIIRSNAEYSFFLELNDDELSKTVLLINTLEEIKSSFDLEFADICDLRMNSLGLNIIEALCLSYQKHYNSQRDPDIVRYKRMADNIQYICNNYNSKITIKMLADKMNMSESAYNILFKKVFKIPPMQYIINYRLSKAKNLLINTDMTITEIAHSTGFYDSAHLNKAFLESENICPTKYRVKKKLSKD